MKLSHLLFPLLGLIPCRVFAQVVLSEIMFNAPQSDYYEEYVELYNSSATNWLDLTGSRLGDAQEQDALVAYSGTLFLPPQSYALILDPGYWSNSAIYDSLIPPNTLILTISGNDFGNSGFNNSTAEPVLLINSSGDTLAFYTYTADNPGGISEEKIRLTGGDDPGNWSNSLVYLGTPGFLNSVLPPDSDLAITAIQIQPSPLPLNTPVSLAASLSNLGLTPTPNGQLTFGLGEIEASFPTVIIASTEFPPLDPGITTNLTINLTGLPAGSQRLWGWHDLNDANPLNDTLSQLLLGSYPGKSLVINELMVSPPANTSEWVELFNPTSDPVNLLSFSFTDLDTSERVLLTSSSLVVNAQQFVLLAQDSSLLDLSLPGTVPVLILGSDWLILNNNGDTPTLLDAAALIQDQVPYTGWDVPDGKSLERISPLNSSADPANWRFSTAPAGATPGAPNTVPPIVPPIVSGDWSFTPDPFDPDQHGTLQITVTIPNYAASIALIAFDLRGRKLKVIFDGEVSPGQWQTIWDGKDSSSRRLAPGLYLLFVEFRDANRNRKSSLKKTLVIAGQL